MPQLKRSLVTSHHKEQHVEDEAKIHPSSSSTSIQSPNELFVIEQTGELFASYEEYLERICLYYQSVWTCRLTGRTGFTYYEALESEAEARRSLESFPEWWKPVVLTITHCSEDSLDLLAGKIVNFCRTHLALNEPVAMSFNDQVYHGLVSAIPPKDVFYETCGASDGINKMESAELVPGYASSGYRITINDGEMIMTGACSGPQDVQRTSNLPSKSLLKKFIRTAAIRLGHAGMPWMVDEKYLEKFHISKILTPEAEERLEGIKLLYKQRTAKKKQPFKIIAGKDGGSTTATNAITATTVAAAATVPAIRYPILEEFLPESKKTDSSLWPTPKHFNPKLSIVSASLMGEVLEIWHFIQCLSSVLEIKQMSLANFISSLEHTRPNNPIFKAIVKAFVKKITSAVGKDDNYLESIEQYLEAAKQDSLNKTMGCFIPTTAEKASLSLESDADVDAGNVNVNNNKKSSNSDNEDKDNDENNESILDEYVFAYEEIANESSDWDHQLVQLLGQLRGIPKVKSILLKLHKDNEGLYEINGALKIQLLVILRDFYLTVVSIKAPIDAGIAHAAQAKQDLREAEHTARNHSRECQRLMMERDGAQKELDQAIVLSQDASSSPSQTNGDKIKMRKLKEQLRQLDRKVTAESGKEVKMSRKIEELKREINVYEAIRVRPLGEDREFRLYWWFDYHLLSNTNGKRPFVGSGIVLVQRQDDDSWSFYDDIEQIDSLINYLNPLGCREAHLGASLSDIRDHLFNDSLLFTFPHSDHTFMEIDKIEEAETAEGAGSDSEDEMVLRRPKRKKPVELPEFLKYTNTNRNEVNVFLPRKR